MNGLVTNVERPFNEPSTRASDSVYVSKEVKTSKIETTSTRANGWQIDEQFCGFRAAYLSTGASTTELDWADAYFEWKVLDFEQKLAATAHVKTCDPAFIKLPKNYLNRHEWERLPRPAPKTKLERIMDEL